MKKVNYLKTIFAVVLLATFAAAVFAQQTIATNFPEPRQEKLLNGLKLLIWNDPSAELATVKIRIHNGAAFDPKDKMGTMALLSDILFPTEEARAFFSEELGGKLEITTTYDYLQITATGKADEIQAMLETLATVVTDPPITQENFVLVRDARLEKIRELEKNPSYVADQAVAKRLFGDFPYGRSIEGTPESLAKIDRVDLMFARDRFFTSDNATIAVAGKIQPDFVYRAARRLFGAWKKADSKIPATFRQPEAPNPEQLVVEIPNLDKTFSKSAVTAVSRNDKDYFPTLIFTGMFEKQACLNEGAVDYQAHLLKGVFSFGGKTAENSAASSPAGRPCRFILEISPDAPNNGNGLSMPQEAEFETVKAKIAADFSQKLQSRAELAEMWLDVDTFKLVSVKDEIARLNGVIFADVKRVAENLRKQPFAIISLRNAKTASQQN